MISKVKGRTWPFGTRIFVARDGDGFWVFGPGTEYPIGDFYCFGDDNQVAPSLYTLDGMASVFHATEVPLNQDIDLFMDEGL